MLDGVKVNDQSTPSYEDSLDQPFLSLNGLFDWAEWNIRAGVTLL
ncbi:MAG: hypothetical protein ABI844_03025 [Saprospiraceae bacterium]